MAMVVAVGPLCLNESLWQLEPHSPIRRRRSGLAEHDCSAAKRKPRYWGHVLEHAERGSDALVSGLTPQEYGDGIVIIANASGTPLYAGAVPEAG